MRLIPIPRQLPLVVLALTSFLPFWWLAGQISQQDRLRFLRPLLTFGLWLVGFLTFVNLVGRAFENSIAGLVGFWIVYVALGVLILLRRGPDLESNGSLSPGTEWILFLGLGTLLALPQLVLAVSTNYWDEAVSSAIHLTGPNQFAEGVFPPRHNAFPEINVKYHYGFIILSGTVRWLTGLSANHSIDLVSTALWMFIFLFVVFWLRDLGLPRFAATSGGVALLLGGGLSWIYLPWLETYGGFGKTPDPSLLAHSYDQEAGWIGNLVTIARNQNAHLRNADGTYSSLPLEVTNYFQQHAVAVGMAVTLVALFLFCRWRTRNEPSPLLLICCVVAFSVLFLCHAVFGAIACVAAGLLLLRDWIVRRDRRTFVEGLSFTGGVTALAFLHGGMFARGAEYGASGLLAWRGNFGYSSGGLTGFAHWNLAGFGLPLLLALAAFGYLRLKRDSKPGERGLLLSLMALFALISYLIPQLFFYSYAASGVEQSTEISKFFFATRFGLAILSAFGAAWLSRILPGPSLLLAWLLMLVTPLAVCYAGAFDTTGRWLGFYDSPYAHSGGRVRREMGEALAKARSSNREIYFDMSAGERRSGFLSELLVYGGSVFTLTPSRFERTGLGFRLSPDLIAKKYVVNSRLARLLPGAAQEANCSWLYLRPLHDLTHKPVVVRSRYARMVSEGYLSTVREEGDRALHRFDRDTADIDLGIERYWRPKLITQAGTDWDGDGADDLVFFDYRERVVVVGNDRIPLPDRFLESAFPQLSVATFPGESRVDFLVARKADTFYRQGQTLSDLVEQSGYFWSYRDSGSGVWQDEYQYWFWDKDIPFIADLNKDGLDGHFGYRPSTGQWFLFRDRTLEGPEMPEDQIPLPFAGRFLEGSTGDLGLWSVRTGRIELRSQHTGRTVSIASWGGLAGDILLPGDYDGDGYDELGIWQRHNQYWFWKRMPEGRVSDAQFGTITGIPLPNDFDGDGSLDLAYWEPKDNKIFVSFDKGRTISRTIIVPPDSIPAFVNMY